MLYCMGYLTVIAVTVIVSSSTTAAYVCYQKRIVLAYNFDLTEFYQTKESVVERGDRGDIINDQPQMRYKKRKEKTRNLWIDIIYLIIFTIHYRQLFSDMYVLCVLLGCLLYFNIIPLLLYWYRLSVCDVGAMVLNKRKGWW